MLTVADVPVQKYFKADYAARGTMAFQGILPSRPSQDRIDVVLTEAQDRPGSYGDLTQLLDAVTHRAAACAGLS